MNLREQLARNLSAESEAYGYTLTIWGGGSVLINQYGTPTIGQIFLYVGGALVAFATLAAVAFPHLFTEHEAGQSRQLVIASTIHLIATFGSLGLAYFLTRTAITSAIPAWVSFSFIGFQLTLTYNLFVLSERAVGRVVATIHPNTDGS